MSEADRPSGRDLTAKPDTGYFSDTLLEREPIRCRPLYQNVALGIVASETEPAQRALASLREHYDCVPPSEAEIIIALGGDGFMLQTLHAQLEAMIDGSGRAPKPVYGMNCGTIGFLMNSFEVEGLHERVMAAEATSVSPLAMRAHYLDGGHEEALAINEVALLRETRQAAKLRISIDGRVRMEELICDGALVSTPAGSTAYNLSAHGPIIPIGAELLALTPISAFRPRRWRGALLPDSVTVRFEILEPAKRPVSAVADFKEMRDVRRVDVRRAEKHALSLLFDPGHSLEERLIGEQFLS
ncbi:MAG: NAD kinase [Neomegalonema sp.]|nr:NAD kinase [Neomegalonema sp.]